MERVRAYFHESKLHHESLLKFKDFETMFRSKLVVKNHNKATINMLLKIFNMKLPAVSELP